VATRAGPLPASLLACLLAAVEVKGTAVDLDYHASIRPAEVGFLPGDADVQPGEAPVGRAQNLQGRDFGAAARTFERQSRVTRQHLGQSARSAPPAIVTEPISELSQRRVLETNGLADSACQRLPADRSREVQQRARDRSDRNSIDGGHLVDQRRTAEGEDSPNAPRRSAARIQPSG
jgi:hypothetical protein